MKVTFASNYFVMTTNVEVAPDETYEEQIIINTANDLIEDYYGFSPIKFAKYIEVEEN
jgi:hypothetical protein